MRDPGRPSALALLRWLCALAGLVAAPAGALDLVVRDARTGVGLEASLRLAPAEAPLATRSALAAALRQAGPRALYLRAGGGRLQVAIDAPTAALVEHPGHRPLWALLEPGAPAGQWTLWLSPAAEPAQPAAADTLTGHVVDPLTLAPVAGARVRLAGDEAASRTGADGGFRLALPPGPAPDTLRRGLLIVEAADGRRSERALALAPGADLHVLVDLDGTADGDPGHRHLGPPGDAQLPLAIAQPAPDPARRMPAGDGDEPPASIRVGYGNAGCSATCCTGSCSHVCVFDLETYVRRGLNDEWIASWNGQSLRAGAVAYRSYGAWHALNPVPGRPFDLCSSACCQVNDADTSSASDLAVAATAGLMLVRGQAVFRSEYSAENNCLLGTASCANSDLSCGNGFAGSPAAGWPCLADPVGTDRDCFGHGRGMSQWGTQRWSLAPHLRSWRWQLDHYYNGNGAGSGLRTATPSRVLVLEGLHGAPRTLRPGDTLEIRYQARNLAATSHNLVLLGASLRSPPGPFVDDPGNDDLVSLPPGPAERSRVFAIPASLPPGRYDLYGSLYIDVDGDGAIAPGDLAQALVHRPGTLRVVAAGDLIFADGF